MVIFSLDSDNPILFDPILIGGLPWYAIPTQPVGDPVPRPATPQPAPPQRDPDEPVHAPHPREPELPAIDPHEPGLPDTRIDHWYGDPRIGDPPLSSSERRWLI